jgi:hypothetical protein
MANTKPLEKAPQKQTPTQRMFTKGIGSKNPHESLASSRFAANTEMISKALDLQNQGIVKSIIDVGANNYRNSKILKILGESPTKIKGLSPKVIASDYGAVHKSGGMLEKTFAEVGPFKDTALLFVHSIWYLTEADMNILAESIKRGCIVLAMIHVYNEAQQIVLGYDDEEIAVATLTGLPPNMYCHMQVEGNMNDYKHPIPDLCYGGTQKVDSGYLVANSISQYEPDVIVRIDFAEKLDPRFTSLRRGESPFSNHIAMYCDDLEPDYSFMERLYHNWWPWATRDPTFDPQLNRYHNIDSKSVVVIDSEVIASVELALGAYNDTDRERFKQKTILRTVNETYSKRSSLYRLALAKGVSGYFSDRTFDEKGKSWNKTKIMAAGIALAALCYSDSKLFTYTSWLTLFGVCTKTYTRYKEMPSFQPPRRYKTEDFRCLAATELLDHEHPPALQPLVEDGILMPCKPSIGSVSLGFETNWDTFCYKGCIHNTLVALSKRILISRPAWIGPDGKVPEEKMIAIHEMEQLFNIHKNKFVRRTLQIHTNFEDYLSLNEYVDSLPGPKRKAAVAFLAKNSLIEKVAEWNTFRRARGFHIVSAFVKTDEIAHASLTDEGLVKLDKPRVIFSFDQVVVLACARYARMIGSLMKRIFAGEYQVTHTHKTGRSVVIPIWFSGYTLNDFNAKIDSLPFDPRSARCVDVSSMDATHSNLFREMGYEALVEAFEILNYPISHGELEMIKAVMTGKTRAKFGPRDDMKFIDLPDILVTGQIFTSYNNTFTSLAIVTAAMRKIDGTHAVFAQGDDILILSTALTIPFKILNDQYANSNFKITSATADFAKGEGLDIEFCGTTMLSTNPIVMIPQVPRVLVKLFSGKVRGQTFDKDERFQEKLAAYAFSAPATPILRDVVAAYLIKPEVIRDVGYKVLATKYMADYTDESFKAFLHHYSITKRDYDDFLIDLNTSHFSGKICNKVMNLLLSHYKVDCW